MRERERSREVEREEVLIEIENVLSPLSTPSSSLPA